jgi:TRAP-type C4-dicarboxylate transport system substrate-binding protein
MNMGEVYSAIQTGVVAGQENPIETIVAYGFHNICDYLIITNHIVKPAFVAINNDFYNGLSEEYQQLVSEACEEARVYAEEVLANEIENYYKQCTDAGMTIIEPDLAPFVEVTQSVRDELGVKVWGEETYNKILELAGKK